MSKKATEFQKKEMSKMYRGKEIFKPLNTGWIDENVACVREWVANIFFYRKGDTTIMIDAGYNYDRLAEKMGWLGIDPASIRHILITHQDTDHVGAVEADSPGLFKNAKLYIGEVENRYLTGEVRRKVIYPIACTSCRRSRSTTKRYCCMTARFSILAASKSNASLSPVIPGGTWYISLTISICSPATRCGSVRTADTALFPLWQRIISWLCSHWRSWNGNCTPVVCIRISSPVTRDGRTIWNLLLPVRTSSVRHSRNGYTTRRHPMMPTTNRTTPKKMQRAVF